MTQQRTRKRNTSRTIVLSASIAGLVVVAALYPQYAAQAASDPASASSAAKGSAGETPLIRALDTELKRAMSSLGATGAAAQHKPYFLSYAVSDATQVASQYRHCLRFSSFDRGIRTEFSGMIG